MTSVFFQLDSLGCPSKRVYQLSQELAEDPDQVVKAQSMTLNTARPLLGLRGSHGLFGSKEWWSSIAAGVIPVVLRSGTITDMYFPGRPGEYKVKDFEYVGDDGVARSETCRANAKSDLSLYQVGGRVGLAYARDELKKQPAKDGSTNYAGILLEVVVSI